MYLHELTFPMLLLNYELERQQYLPGGFIQHPYYVAGVVVSALGLEAMFYLGYDPIGAYFQTQYKKGKLGIEYAESNGEITTIILWTFGLAVSYVIVHRKWLWRVITRKPKPKPKDPREMIVDAFSDEETRSEIALRAVAEYLEEEGNEI